MGIILRHLWIRAANNTRDTPDSAIYDIVIQWSITRAESAAEYIVDRLMAKTNYRLLIRILLVVLLLFVGFKEFKKNEINNR